MVRAYPLHRPFSVISEIGATTGGLPLQENETALHPPLPPPRGDGEIQEEDRSSEAVENKAILDKLGSFGIVREDSSLIRSIC
ncbi:MAG: hypothetical protein ACM65L_09650 [Microcoleus sp.]